MKERIYSPSLASCPRSYCFSDFSSPFSQLFDYASYYCRISCGFLLSTLSIFDVSCSQGPHLPGGTSPFSRRLFSCFPRFSRPPSPALVQVSLSRPPLHKIFHKKLLRRVIHTFHRVFHIALSLDIKAFPALLPVLHLVENRLSTCCAPTLSLHKTLPFRKFSIFFSNRLWTSGFFVEKEKSSA